jgi:uncharacterized protein (TIGR00297 family)
MDLLIALSLADGVGPVATVPVIALGAWATGAMSWRGALGGVGIGLAITAGAGWAGLAMLGSLLLFGTLVSRRGARRRSALQAFCNGAAASVAALAALGGAAWGVAAVGGALSVALSDTVSGELGRRLDRKPRLLLLGRVLPSGADGAMSIPGTLLGAVAALVVPAFGKFAGAPWGWPEVMAIAAAGLAGNLLDSLLGAFVQPRLGRFGNDWVNLLATSAGALLAAQSAGALG